MTATLQNTSTSEAENLLPGQPTAAGIEYQTQIHAAEIHEDLARKLGVGEVSEKTYETFLGLHTDLQDRITARFAAGPDDEKTLFSVFLGEIINWRSKQLEASARQFTSTEKRVGDLRQQLQTR